MLASQALLSTLLFPLVVLSTPVAVRRLQARLERVPRGFVSLGEASFSQPITLTLALASNNVTGLEQELYAVSTPGSSRYGQYLSRDQVDSYMAPTVNARAAVSDWLSTYNITGRSIASAGDWISFSVPIATANDMLTARYETFAHVETGNVYPRTLSYSLPAQVADHIEHIHPSTIFDKPQPLKTTTSAVDRHTSREQVQGPCPGGNVTPDCLQHLYGIPSSPATSKNNGMVVTGFAKASPQRDDLASFLRQFRADMAPNTTFALTQLDGASQCEQCNSNETQEALDIQYTVGLATNVPVEFVAAGDNGNLDHWITLINNISRRETVPTVISSSYGIDEGGDKGICNLFLALSARGVSSLWCSGDDGVIGFKDDKCAAEFRPTFPSSCPLQVPSLPLSRSTFIELTDSITSVGATTVNANMTEQGADFSSGGFSNFSQFEAPEYQKAAVSTYLGALGSINQGSFNPGGRAYPDVSAAGFQFQVIIQGKTNNIFGTSASTPVFASVIALLNDRLLAAGKPTLGFLNPWLYQNPDMFNDVTDGNNKPACDNEGFPAKKGWDPVTGLGTPDFKKMLAAALNASGGNNTAGSLVSDCS
ncbi:family S53 protease [Mycena vitilis]|nr:family S53 protease [Mycena vitilis]